MSFTFIQMSKPLKYDLIRTEANYLILKWWLERLNMMIDCITVSGQPMKGWKDGSLNPRDVSFDWTHEMFHLIEACDTIIVHWYLSKIKQVFHMSVLYNTLNILDTYLRLETDWSIFNLFCSTRFVLLSKDITSMLFWLSDTIAWYNNMLIRRIRMDNN